MLSSARAFLSYAHVEPDAAFAAHLSDALSRRGLRVWYDRDLKARGGADLNKEIADAITESNLVISVATGAAYASRYCLAELIYACELGKPIMSLALDGPPTRPDILLPLAPYPVLDLKGLDSDRAIARIVDAIRLAGISIADLDETADPAPAFRRIWPSYSWLRTQTADQLRERVRRLVEARALNPQNGWSALSEALLWIQLESLERATTQAQAAVSELPLEPEPLYVLGLCDALAAGRPPRSRPKVEAALAHLAQARRKQSPRAHADVLSAILVRSYYLEHRLTPPASPEFFLDLAVKDDRIIDAGEFDRLAHLFPEHQTMIADALTSAARVRGIHEGATP